MMNPSTIAMVLTIVAVGVALAMGPRWSRKRVYFGLSVAADFAESATGRRIFRVYAGSLGLASAVAIGIAIIEVKMAGVGLLLMGATQVMAFWWARQETRPHRQESSGLRTASLVTRATSLPGGWPAWLLPLAMPLISVGLAARYWNGVPLRMPVHYGVSGAADRWVMATTWWGVNAMPLVAFGISLAVVLMGWHVAKSRQVSPRGEAAASESGRRQLSLRLLFGTLYVINALFVAMMLEALKLIERLPPAMMFAIFGGGFAVMMGLYFRYWQEWHDVEPAHDGTADECWHWGMFYANPSDPAVLVERRVGFGYTLNFSRPAAWGILALALGPVLMMAFLR